MQCSAASSWYIPRSPCNANFLVVGVAFSKQWLGSNNSRLGMAQACSLADRPVIHGREQHKADALKQVPQSCTTPTQRRKAQRSARIKNWKREGKKKKRTLFWILKHLSIPGQSKRCSMAGGSQFRMTKDYASRVTLFNPLLAMLKQCQQLRPQCM